MAATVMDGRAAAAEIRADLATRVARLRERGIVPGLGTVLVGEDAGSLAYVAGKHRDSAAIGVASFRCDLPAGTSMAELGERIDAWNADDAVTGFLVQVPLPAPLDDHAALALVDPSKDVDGLHPVNLGRLAQGLPAPRACTARAIVDLLGRYGVELAGAEVCVIGRGTTVGRPLSLLLSLTDATVTVCHTRTRDLAAHTRRADVVVAAAGSPGLVRAEMIRPGAVVVDVGITRTGEGLRGDTDPGVREVASLLAPVPGGVGPMTRAMLLANVVERAEERARGGDDQAAR